MLHQKQFAALLTLLSVLAFAQLSTSAEDTKRANLDRVDKVTQDFSVRASKVIGMEVRNEKGEKLGKVNDLVLDTKTSKIRYAALSFGGVLGLGDKLFAIPWSAMDCRKAKDSNDYFLVLAIDPQILKNSKGFDQDHWPDFGDNTITSQFDQLHAPVRR
jgi:sporulation protein YlmC with PRC-barrel domain